MHVDTPHFGFPFERGVDGHPNHVEQDTAAHVMACENVILRCPTGFRVDRPAFGVPYAEYDLEPDPDSLAQALRRFEPRSEVHTSTARDFTRRAQATITVEVEVQGA